jgi:hypothetical protein
MFFQVGPTQVDSTGTQKEKEKEKEKEKKYYCI